MRLTTLLLLLLVAQSCHEDVALNDQLYGKWILTSGTTLTKRQTSVRPDPVYFIFTTHGSIESNWSNCYAFRFGKPNEFLIGDSCADCIANGCESVWHYEIKSANELTIEFQAADVGVLQRQ